MAGRRALQNACRFLLCGVAAAIVPHLVLAQDAPSSMGILRSTGDHVPADLASQADSALLRGLADIANIRNPTVSPASYEAVQLAVGCEGESRACLASVAETLQTEAIIVRRLNVDASGLTTLDLFYFAPARSGEIASAQATVSAGAEPSIAAAVPRLVRKLFGVSDPVSAQPVLAQVQRPVETAEASSAEPPPLRSDTDAEARRASEPRSGGTLRTWAWVTMLSGAAVLGTGVVVGLTASSSFADLKKTNPRTIAEAQRVHSDFDSIQTRGTIANVLMPVGGAMLATGVALLIVDLSHGAGSSELPSEQVVVVTTRGGAMLSLQGAVGGF